MIEPFASLGEAFIFPDGPSVSARFALPRQVPNTLRVGRPLTVTDLHTNRWTRGVNVHAETLRVRIWRVTDVRGVDARRRHLNVHRAIFG